MSIEFSHNGQRTSRDPISVVGTKSTLILDYNLHRRYAYIYNHSASDTVWITFTLPAEPLKSIPILPKSSYVVDYSNLTPVDISAITESAGVTAIVSVTECV